MLEYILIALIITFSLMVLFWVWCGITVPEGREYVIERLGKFHRVLRAGPRYKIPYLESIRAKVSVQEEYLDIPQQEIITSDNAQVKADAITFIRVVDSKQAVYEVEDYKKAVSQLVQTYLRRVMADMTLDKAVKSRDEIKEFVTKEITDDVHNWGIQVLRVEIRDIKTAKALREAMEKDAAAQRFQKASHTDAESRRIEEIFKADAEKKAAVLRAKGKVESTEHEVAAKRLIAEELEDNLKNVQKLIKDDRLAVQFILGEKYIEALKEMSESPNTKLVLLPTDLMQTIETLISKK